MTSRSPETRERIRWMRIVVPIVLLAIVAIPATAAAGARSRGLDFRCRLIATKQGEQITVTFRLRTSRPRDDWRIRLSHDGELIYSRIRPTNAIGNLRVVRVVPNLPRHDDLEARARNIATRRTCDVESRI